MINYLQMSVFMAAGPGFEPGLRRLMRNSEKRGRSRNPMLTPYLDQKAVSRGSRLLPPLIVRPHRRVVEGHSLPAHRRSWSSIAHLRRGDTHTDHPRPMAALQEREGFLALRQRPPQGVFPHAALPEPVQSQGEGFGGRDEIPPALFGEDPRPEGSGLPRF